MYASDVTICDPDKGWPHVITCSWRCQQELPEAFDDAVQECMAHGHHEEIVVVYIVKVSHGRAESMAAKVPYVCLCRVIFYEESSIKLVIMAYQNLLIPTECAFPRASLFTIQVTLEPERSCMVAIQGSQQITTATCIPCRMYRPFNGHVAC